MARIDLSDRLAPTRARLAEQDAAGDTAPEPAPFARLTRKETRVREDQYAALSTLSRRLMRQRVRKEERITENTLIRIAIDLLLAHSDALRGSTEAELRDTVTTALTDSGSSGLPESVTSAPWKPGTSEVTAPGTAELRQPDTSAVTDSGSSGVWHSDSSDVSDAATPDVPESGSSSIRQSESPGVRAQGAVASASLITVPVGAGRGGAR